MSKTRKSAQKPVSSAKSLKLRKIGIVVRHFQPEADAFGVQLARLILAKGHRVVLADESTSAVKAFKADDNWQRLTLDCICLTLIGTLMILTSLSIKIAALGALAAFFAANPWLMPVLFLLSALPIASEVIGRVVKIYQEKDIGSQILKLERKTDFTVTYTEKQGKAPVVKSITYTLEQIQEMSPHDRIVALNRIMNYFQTTIGADAAIKAFEYLESFIDPARVADRFTKQTALEKSLAEWNFAQKVRLFQQFLYLVSFVLSMALLKTPRQVGTALKEAQNGLLFTGNFIPFYMDSLWPFKRNTQIVVDPVLNDGELERADLLQLFNQKIPQKVLA